jgi:hypothetical protein
VAVAATATMVVGLRGHGRAAQVLVAAGARPAHPREDSKASWSSTSVWRAGELGQPGDEHKQGHRLGLGDADERGQQPGGLAAPVPGWDGGRMRP